MPKVFKKMFKVDLQMFNDGGTAGASEGIQASVASTENAPKVETKPSGSNRRSKSGEFDTVVFGKQESTPSNDTASLTPGGNTSMGAEEGDVRTTSDTLEARRKAYNDLINGEYKDIDQERFQQVFDRRFKQVKGIEAELEAQKPILDMLKSRYGVESVADVQKALTEDTEYWESAAEARGLTVEQYHAIQKLEQDQAELRRIREREVGQAKFQQQIDTWYREAEAVKGLYPSFNFKAEVQNPQFLELLKRGVGVEHAYKVLHFDELTNNAARVAAQTADAQAQAKIKSKSSRPSENGTSSKSAVIVKSDVSQLTRKERAEIARRVARGETISF